jgi:hypothetical protein
MRCKDSIFLDEIAALLVIKMANHVNRISVPVGSLGIMTA